MANTHASLTALFTAIANAIRGKTGEEGALKADDFPTAIAAIPSGLSGVEKDLWTTGADIPVSTSIETSQLHNGKIYLAQNIAGTAMLIYDIATNLWTTGALTPSAVAKKTSQIYNGKIYYPADAGTAMQIYDIATNAWTTGAAAPAVATRSTSQMYNGRIYCPQNTGVAMQVYTALAFAS